MVKAKQWVLKTATAPGEPFNFNFEDANSTFQLIDKELSADQLAPGGILVETYLIANDPAQKFWIASADKNYSKGVQYGENIPARGIGRVIGSRNENYAIGDYVAGKVCWTTAIIIEDPSFDDVQKIPKDHVGELWWYLSVFGSTALTAYFIFYKYIGLKERKDDYGKQYLISGAAGSVGTICIQLALNVFKASKVIAIAGGPEKVDYVESFGDKVIGVDYKSENFNSALCEAAGGENTIDYFIDNVGGDILDIGVTLSKVNSIVVACGSISGYNHPEKFVFKNYIMVITKRLTIKGLLVTDCKQDFPQAIKRLQELVKNGDINVKNSATLVDATEQKFEYVPIIWSGLFKGINKGKLITVVKEAD